MQDIILAYMLEYLQQIFQRDEQNWHNDQYKIIDTKINVANIKNTLEVNAAASSVCILKSP